jgi:ribose 1,5-bisphosphokinase PhnN
MHLSPSSDADRATAAPGDLSTRRPVLVLVGPSGAGKSALVAELARLGAVTVHPTWTTRPPRPDELDGCPEHRFVSERRFDHLAEAGFFCDVVRPFDGAHRYGFARLPRRPAGPPAAVETIDTVLLRATYLDRVGGRLGPLVVYHVDAPVPVLAARMAARGTGPEEIAARLAFDLADTALGRCSADRILPNDGTLGSLVARTLAALASDFGSADTHAGSAA